VLECQSNHPGFVDGAKIKGFQTPPFGNGRPSHLSCERDKQPTFKFDIDLEMFFIYHWIPRKLGFLG
jgi:hypothetical protein